MYIETTSSRLKQILKDKNLRQVDLLNLVKPLCEKYNVKMNKSDISQYVSGLVKPGQEKLFILGKALNVDEAWLMGCDVPMKRNIVKETKSTYNPNEITEKDEKSIQRDLKKIMDDFRTGQDGPAFYNGVELDEEELDLIEQAMELALRSAKIKNKAKYTPKKYRKDNDKI